jgi:hypothetical protein
MGEFAVELQRRVQAAEESLRSAHQDGDDYLLSVRAGELESLQHLASEHDVVVGPVVDLRAAAPAGG